MLWGAIQIPPLAHSPSCRKCRLLVAQLSPLLGYVPGLREPPLPRLHLLPKDRQHSTPGQCGCWPDQSLVSLPKFRATLNGHPRSSAPHIIDESLCLDCFALQLLLLPNTIPLTFNKYPECKFPSQYLFAIEPDINNSSEVTFQGTVRLIFQKLH